MPARDYPKIKKKKTEDKKPNRLTENIETENRASLEVFLRDARFFSASETYRAYGRLILRLFPAISA